MPCFLISRVLWGRAIPEKSKEEGWGHTFLIKTPGIFRFITLPLEIPNKMKLYPWKFHTIVLHPLEFPWPKTKPTEIPDVFLITPENSTSLLTPRIFTSIFSISLEISSPQPMPPHPAWIFSRVAPFWKNVD